MERLEEIVAQNLTELRKARKWTQAELAEKLNYSDKSVSKWERGDALPDLKVLTQLAELFEVTLDYFVTENAAQSRSQFDLPKRERGFRIGVMLLWVSAVWLIALSVFVFTAASPSIGHGYWMALIWAIPLSALSISILSIHWKFRVLSIVFESVFSWSALTAVFLQLLVGFSWNLWMLFLVGVPLQAAIILWAQIRSHRV